MEPMTSIFRGSRGLQFLPQFENGYLKVSYGVCFCKVSSQSAPSGWEPFSWEKLKKYGGCYFSIKTCLFFRIGKTKEYYEFILKQVNGVLLPGGAVWFHESNGFADAGKYIFKFAVEMNKNGDYFPLWGTCLGYELLLYVSNSGKDPRQDCAAMDDYAPLHLKEDFRKSRMLQKLPLDLENILKNEDVTYNFHRYCITEEDLKQSDLLRDWRVISTNKDRNGLEFISCIEHKRFPFYGVQFHPEKNAYEFTETTNIKNLENAIKVSQYFAHFFVSECKKNEHQFLDKKEEYRHLIYNFPITFTGQSNCRWLQCYLFKENVNYPDTS